MTKYRIDYESGYEAYLEQSAAEPKMYWTEGNEPPKWKQPTRGNLNHYRWAMIDFVEWQLFNQLPEPDLTPTNSPDVYKRHIEWLTERQKNRGPEIEAAERGDIEPLRRKYPHLVPFLHIPECKRGVPLSDRVYRAANMVPAVRAIWQRTYGRTLRRDKPSAVEIVAYIFGVEVRHVKLQLSREKAARRQNKKLGSTKRFPKKTLTMF